MAKAKTSDKLEMIRQALAGRKLMIGTRQALNNLVLGKLSSVFMASNCPQALKARLKHAAQLSNAELLELDIQSDELGALCKKQYNILAVSLKK